jgi:hypothetical protein
VFADRRLAHPEVFGNGIQGQGLTCQKPDDGPPGGVGNGLENISPCAHTMMFKTKPNGLVKVGRKYIFSSHETHPRRLDPYRLYIGLYLTC